MSKQDVIDKFDDEDAWMSNFYVSPISHDGIVYNTVEHFYQAMKSADPAIHRKIASLPHPGQTKKFGNKVALRPDWEENKETVMRSALKAKFKYPDLREKLLATGNTTLVEGNWWHDNIWGNCKCKKCVGIEGKNLLGTMLMEVRASLSLAEGGY